MTTKKAFSLKKGDKVVHKWLGISTVQYVMPDFGPTIIPDSEEARVRLAEASGMSTKTPLLVSDYKQNLKEIS